MKVIGIIPARGGSKGLKNKNILNFFNKPLIVWTIESAVNSKYIDEVVISTDSLEIKEVVSNLGYKCTELRPKELGLDTTTSFEVINYELSKVKDFDVVCMLQPTSPIRNTIDIDKAFEIYFNSKAKSCVSVYKSNEVPFWSFKKDYLGNLDPLFGKEFFSKRRQDLEDVYHLNGAIYISDIIAYLNNKSFISDKTVPYEMNLERSIDIDTLDDFLEAENFFKLNY